MIESYKHPEVINEQELIGLLNLRGVEDQATKAILEKFVDQCHHEADAEVAAAPGNLEISNRANIKADIKIAILYSKTERYKNQARESFEDTYTAASQNDSTYDLAEQIEALIDALES
jgi:hypothetical protein